MGERIDHVEKAITELDFLHAWQTEEGVTDATQLAGVLEAQVHATLALVEAQRIANLIAIYDKLGARSQAAVRDTVTEALGVPEIVKEVFGA